MTLLILLSLYTAMDRQVLGLLAGPLRRDLGIDDTQFGLLQGAGVALFTAVAAYPLAWLADRTERRRVLAVCLAAWCLALAGCAMATGFMELFLVSSLMGGAEAGVIPIAYALIADWFGPRSRQAATSVFVLLGRLGAGVMVAASGWLVASVDGVRPWLPAPWHEAAEWRLALLLTALPGLIIVPLLLSMPRTQSARLEPAKPAIAGDISAAATPAVPDWQRFLGLVLGAGLLAGGAAALAVFMPVLVQRLGALSPAQAGSGLGAAALLAAMVALAISTLLARRDARSAAGAGGLRVSGLGMAAAAAASALLALVATHTQALLLYGCALAGIMTAGMLLVGVLQAQAPSHARTRFMAVFAASTAIAGACSPIAVGALSDAAGTTSMGLAHAMAVLGAPCLAIGAWVLTRTASRFTAVLPGLTPSRS